MKKVLINQPSFLKNLLLPLNKINLISFRKAAIVKAVSIVYFQLLLTAFAVAQNTSYSSNTIPVGGSFSTAFGAGALHVNTGAANSATGYLSLNSNTSGNSNTATGYASLFRNTTGNYNTAIGSLSLYKNTTGTNNNAVGYNSLYNNVNGSFDVAVGTQALYSNTSGSSNTAIGYAALRSNTIAGSNTAIGREALYANTTGSGNTSIGAGALYSNTTGLSNIALGGSALRSNTTAGYNIAIGNAALYTNTTGIGNYAFGHDALRNNTSGRSNMAFGGSALLSNTTGSDNMAIGTNAMSYMTTGSENIGIGSSTLALETTGIRNVAVGGGAMINGSNSNENVAIGNSIFRLGIYNQCIGLGFNSGNADDGDLNGIPDLTVHLEKCILIGDSQLINTTALIKNSIAIGSKINVTTSNKVVIGNTAVTSIGGQVGWTTYSDQRLKTNIKKSELGLDFILSLNPVTYNYKAEGQKDILYTGLIAQEVDEAAKKAGVTFSAVDKNGEMWGIRYGELTVPLIKAVQELQQQVDELKKALAAKDAITIGTASLNNNAVVLDQNVPNPFVSQTTIPYNIPQNADKAKLLFYDAAGRLISTYDIKTKGKGQLTVFGDNLSSGAYTCSLIIDGKPVATKKIIKQ